MMMSDIEIAQNTEMKNINEIAEVAGIDKKYIEQYGNYKAKIDLSLLENLNKKIGKLINDNNIRVDTHPDQYAVLNSMDSKIVKNTVEILEYHYKIMDAIGIKDKIIILHVGSSACGKKASITRFINNFNKLPDHIKKCIAVENDDKVYNIKDVLELCHKINVPMVLDYHHFICNNEKEDINDYLKEIIDTWDGKKSLEVIATT